ncbi:MAG TPA: DUF1552 domain-containing protein [Bryobacteraceae bacterium]|nr:DUF1552 domain-containing protein [Bryobacteraceae bacterium]
MFLTKKSLPRRTILRGMGAAVALPLLDAMIPAATAQTSAVNPRRVGFIYIPHGADMGSWTPAVDGTKLTLSPSLQALEPYQRQLTVITNLKRAGTVQEMHAAAASGWLSGAIPKATEGEDYQVGTTIDQVLARKIGGATPLPSIEFATEDFTGYVGGCTPGYSCTYMNTISWSSPTTPLPMEINPRVAFERLFGDGGSDTQRRRQLQADRSILDSVLGEAKSMQGELGKPDRARVGDYLDNVREIERRIQRAESQNLGDVHLIDKPLGIPDSFEEHTALMFELLAMSMQSDLTRVFTFMMSRESSQRTFPEIGVSDPWHVVSHHGNLPEKVARAAKVNMRCVGMLAKFIQKMSTTPDGDGTMLDHSLIFYGSGMGNSNVHATDPLPMLAFGGGIQGDRHVVLPEKTEIGNLWLGLAHRFGEPLDRFGQSTGIVDL